jgi:hypothetical protein
MTSGGARARGGLPPDPNALRRERPSDQATWTHLPAEGRQGPAPKFPLSDISRRERILWTREWQRPQAVEWERLGMVEQVALYVRALATAEQPDASAPERSLVVRLMDVIGLSVGGLRMNRWIIGGTAEVSRPQIQRGVASASARDRLRLVGNG